MSVSENIKEIYDTNPTSAMVGTDLMYVGRSPFSDADDTAISWLDLLASITADLDPNELVGTDGDNNFISLPYSSSNVASNLVQRDANSNIFANNFNANYASITSSGGNTALTAASARTQEVLGSAAHTVTLPDATTLTTGWCFEIINSSSLTISVNVSPTGLLKFVPSGAILRVILSNNSSVGGAWESQWGIPSSASWGTSGLTLNALTAQLSITCGLTSVTSGLINFIGSTSGTVSVRAQAAAGTYNFNLPTTAGSSSQVLTSAGGGAIPMTWTSLSSAAVTSITANPSSFLTASPSVGAVTIDVDNTHSAQFASLGLNAAPNSLARAFLDGNATAFGILAIDSAKTGVNGGQQAGLVYNSNFTPAVAVTDVFGMSSVNTVVSPGAGAITNAVAQKGKMTSSSNLVTNLVGNWGEVTIQTGGTNVRGFSVYGAPPVGTYAASGAFEGPILVGSNFGSLTTTITPPANGAAIEGSVSVGHTTGSAPSRFNVGTSAQFQVSSTGVITAVGSPLGVTLGGSGTTVQFTPGNIVLAGASGVYTENVNLFFDTTNKIFSVGESIPVSTATCYFSSEDAAKNNEVWINAPTANLANLIWAKAGASKWQMYMPASSSDLRLYDTTDRFIFQFGSFIINTAGGTLKIAAGANACFGTNATMVGGTVTVNTTAVATGDTVLVTKTNEAGVPGTGMPVITIVNNTSLTLTSNSPTDASTYNWMIIKPA
jgi:hypothetical protein